jgi:hypothetical protein
MFHHPAQLRTELRPGFRPDLACATPERPGMCGNAKDVCVALVVDQSEFLSRPDRHRDGRRIEAHADDGSKG